MKTADRIKNNNASWIFPLNVYASLLQTLSGQSPWLVYGEMSAQELETFHGLSASATGLASRTDALIAAQHKRVQRLLAAVQPLSVHSEAASRVLEVGCSNGELVGLLLSTGFDAIGIDCCETPLANSTLSETIVQRLSCCRFEEFTDSAGFDVLIFHNSARYFLPLTLFYKTLTLLRPGGQLLICDEFVANLADNRTAQPLPMLEHVLALAKRIGFECQLHEDLTADTHRFQQVLTATVTALADQLPALAGETDAAIRQLIVDLNDETSASATGYRKHVLLSLRSPNKEVIKVNQQPAPVFLRSAADLPPEAYRHVFESSFSAPFDADVWAWKYLSGKGASVVAERDGQAIAHYGGVVRDILYFSQPCKAVQICDVMVSPQERGFFSRNSLFFKTAASMLEQYAGYNADNLLGVGFPNLRAMHVAQRLGLYEKTDELMQIAMASTVSDELQSLENWTVSEVNFDVPLQQLADELWQQMLTEFSDAIIGVRDADYLRYRFLQRPGLAYNCIKVMQGSEIKALAFCRDHGDRRLLMDIIAAPEHIEQALLVAFQSAHQHKPMHFWLTSGQLDRVIRQKARFEITATGIQIPCNRWSPGPPTDRLINAWWLTAGDMDFL